jgi:hypothetical protein
MLETFKKDLGCDVLIVLIMKNGVCEVTLSSNEIREKLEKY